MLYLEALRARPNVPGDVKEMLELGEWAVGAKTDARARNTFLDHIRGHGNYVLPGDRLGMGSAIAMLLRSIMTGLFICLPLAALGLALISLPIDLVQLAKSWDDKLGAGALLIDDHEHTSGDELIWLFVPSGLALLAMRGSSAWYAAQNGPLAKRGVAVARIRYRGE